jgi:TolB-like protein/DNA-binding winged helix-turn-helix (wHTH) protein
MDAGKALLQFDAIRIDLAGHRVWRAGVEQPLEPKAFAVLVLLAGEPGRVFEREAILDAVWGHAHVTPGTLNRIVTLLRHALGETAEHPRYLHTVHGVGYRFDARMEALAAATEAPDGGSSNPEPSPVSSASPATDPGVAIRGELLVRPASASVSRRWLLMLLGLALVTAVLVSEEWRARRTSAAISAPATQVQAPAPVERIATEPVLVVLPLRPVGEDARGAEFADGLSEELLNLLARIEGLRVTSRTSAFKFRDEHMALPDIARQLGATHLLEGSVRIDGTRLRIALRLVDGSNDRTLWTESYDREFSDIFAVQDSIARAVAETLRLELRLLRASAYAGEDPELYRRYLVARRSFETVSRLGSAEVPAAAEDLRVLLREHPEYPRAWGGLATLLWQLSTVPRPGRDALRSEAEEAAAAALRLDPEQPDAHAVLAALACREQRWADCLDGSRRGVQNAPSDSLWRVWHANRLATLGYVQDSLRESRLAAQLDPLGTLPHQFLGRVLDTLGRHEEALPHLRLAGLPGAHTALYFNAIWRRDFVEARRLAELLDSNVPWRISQLAAVEALQDPARSKQLIAAIEHSERTQPPDDLRESYDFLRFVLPAAQRDYARDIASLDGVQRAGYASYQLIFWMPNQSALRQSAAFQHYVRDSGLLAFWRQNGWPDKCRSDGGEGVVCD